MRGRQSACCFTGHRPGKLPWRYDETDLRCLSLKARMADAAEAAYQEGYRHFLCGMALGCDLYFCECVLRLREKYPDVTVEAAIPCPTQADAWPPDQRRRYGRAAFRFAPLGPRWFGRAGQRADAGIFASAWGWAVVESKGGGNGR